MGAPIEAFSLHYRIHVFELINGKLSQGRNNYDTYIYVKTATNISDRLQYRYIYIYIYTCFITQRGSDSATAAIQCEYKGA